LIWLAVFYFAVGISMALVRDTPRTQNFMSYLLGIPTMAAIYLWCKAEAAERGEVAPGRGPLWAAVFPPLMLPVYFLRTRRFSAAIKATAKALGFYLCLLVVLLVGVIIAAFAFSFGQVR
jgi:hypothetical protein